MRVILFALLALCLRAQAAFDYETFAQRLRDHKVQTVEDALGELPAEMWQYYVLIRDSRSLQGASREFPRVILSGLDGSLLVAFQGDPGLAGHDNLEMIQVRDGGQRFEMRQIRFPDGKNGLHAPEFSDANPAQCLACHRADPRPNWEQYSTWTGSFGEQDDQLLGTEHQAYLDFVAKHGKDERYHRLWREGSPVAPFSDGIPQLDTRPNLFLTKLLARWNAKRITSRLLKGLAGRDRLAVLAALVECDKLPEGAYERVGKVLGLSAADAKVWLTPTSGKNVRGQLLTARGIATTDWSLVFDPQDSASLVSPFRFDRYFDGLFELRDLVEYDLIQTLKAEYPELEPLAGFAGYLPDDDTPPRRATMMNAVNALGGAPEPGTGQICSVVGQSIAAEKP